MSGTWASGWVAGDIVTAAEFAKGLGAIYDTTLGSAAANIDVSGIVDDYAHLLLVFSGRSDAAALSAAVGLRFNNDSAANYDQQYYTMRTSPGNVVTAATTSINCAQVTAASDTAGAVGVSEIIVPNYAGTTLRKAIAWRGWAKETTDGTTTGYESMVGGGEWRSTAAVTRITLTPSAGNFIAGTRLTIYGMGA